VKDYKYVYETTIPWDGWSEELKDIYSTMSRWTEKGMRIELWATAKKWLYATGFVLFCLLVRMGGFFLGIYLILEKRKNIRVVGNTKMAKSVVNQLLRERLLEDI
jgi:hypothetical protein